MEGYLLRDPRGERGCRPLAEGLTEGETALQHAAAVAKSFDAAACFMTPVDRRTRVTVSMVEVIVERIRSHWEAEGCSVPAVLVIVDPLHRLLDPTRPEVEALGETLQQLLDLAQRAHAIVLFSSDTTKAAASGRNEAGGVKRGVELAHSVEMAFRGNYQLLHMPDVALGLITLRENDEHLPPEDATRLQREPAGTMYAEIVNAKARWDMPGRRAAYFLDPAMFRFRPTTSRNLPKERPLVDRIVEFIEGSPRCSENAVRKGVEGRDRAIRETIQQLLREDILRDHGTGTTGRRLQIAGTPHGTRAEQPRNNLTAQGEGQGVVPGGSSYGREPPRGTTSSAALRIEQEATQGELGELGDELRGATQ